MRRTCQKKAQGGSGNLPLIHAQLGDLLRAGEDLHHVARDVPAREGGPESDQCADVGHGVRAHVFNCEGAGAWVLVLLMYIMYMYTYLLYKADARKSGLGADTIERAGAVPDTACGGNIGNVDNGVLSLLTGNSGVPGSAGRGCARRTSPWGSGVARWERRQGISQARTC